MKWQNLLHKKCPKCESALEQLKDRATIFECTNRGACDFLISRRKMFEILTDETHVLRRHLSPHERELLEGAVAQLNA